jgi:hypothetical protein
MKRKVYTTSRERRIDQLIGFAAFPLVNAVIFAANWLLAWAADALHAPTQEVQTFQVCISLLPWIVNGLVLVLIFLFRPYMGIGYIACMGITLCVPVALCGLFVWACYAMCGVASVPNFSALALWLFLGVVLLTLFLLGVGAIAFMIWGLLRR